MRYDIIFNAIISRDGSSRCGLTAAALLLIDMMLLDEVVDPFLACRYVLASRPEAISQVNQLNVKFFDELNNS